MMADEPIFGRTVKSAAKYVIVQHWLRSPAATAASASSRDSLLSPSSARLSLIQCQGCSLCDVSAGLTTGQRVDNSLVSFPCHFRLTHSQCTDLRHLTLSADNSTSACRQLNSTFHQLLFALRSTYNAHVDFRVPSDSSARSLRSSVLPGLFFRPPALSSSSSLIAISDCARSFCKQLFAARDLDSLISLPSLQPLNLLYSQIHWDYTFSVSRFSVTLPKGTTSFSESDHFIFHFKLMFDGLPLLSRLQQRRPDMYASDTLCFMCGLEPESWSHLWRCTFTRPDLHMTLINFKLFLESFIRTSPRSHLFATHMARWDALDCWLVPSGFSPSIAVSPIILDFSFLLRGFIPLSLVEFLSIFFSKRDVLELLSVAVCWAQSAFRSHTWLSRCVEVKRRESFYHLVRDLNEVGSTSVTRSSHGFPPAPPVQWKDWLSGMLSLGSRFIMEGFRLYANIFLPY